MHCQNCDVSRSFASRDELSSALGEFGKRHDGVLQTNNFAPFVYRPVRHVLSVKRAVQLRYGVLQSSIIAWGSLVSRDLREVEIVGSNPTAVTRI